MGQLPRRQPRRPNGPLAGLTEGECDDRRGATATGGVPITDPSIRAVLDLTEGTDPIYARRRPQWRRQGPNGHRRDAGDELRRRHDSGRRRNDEPVRERERGEVQEERQLTLSTYSLSAVVEEG